MLSLEKVIQCLFMSVRAESGQLLHAFQMGFSDALISAFDFNIDKKWLDSCERASRSIKNLTGLKICPESAMLKQAQINSYLSLVS